MGELPFEVLLRPKPTEHYGWGLVTAMPVRSLVATGPAIGLLAVAGLLVRPGVKGGWIVPGMCGGWLVLHTARFRVGADATGGYARFFCSVAPLSAVLALAALAALRRDRGAESRRVAVALAALAAALPWAVWREAPALPPRWQPTFQLGLTVLVPVAAVVALAAAATARSGGRARQVGAWLLAVIGVAATAALPLVLVRPHGRDHEVRAVERAVAWLRASAHADAPVVATHIWASYLLDRGRNVVAADGTPILEGASPGTVLLWDTGYSPGSRFGITERALRDHPEWQELWRDPETAGATPGARLLIRRNMEAQSHGDAP
jgi:hypothetical protein